MYHQIKSILGLFLSSVTQLKSDAVKYLLYSGLLAAFVFTSIIYLTWKFAGAAGDKIAEWIPWTWAHESMVFSFIVGVTVIVLVFMLMKYILLILMSPLLSIVSEKAEKHMTGIIGGAGFSFPAFDSRAGTRNKYFGFALDFYCTGLLHRIWYHGLLFGKTFYFWSNHTDGV